LSEMSVERSRWLGSGAEEAIDPELAICDPHHHLWDFDEDRYLMADLLADANAGHNIVQTVFVECGQKYRESGPEELRPVGETEFVLDAIAEAGPEGDRLLTGIIGFADLRLGSAVEPVLEAHRSAAGPRFKGIRHAAAWDPSPQVHNHRTDPAGDLLMGESFREGVRTLGRLGLTYDSWAYHGQLDAIADLARAVPETTIIVDHLGGPLGVGPYAGHHDKVLLESRTGLERLAELANTRLKLGGIGMSVMGQRWHHRERPPSSADLADYWGSHMAWCIDTFGPDRAMFESNFPPDRRSCSYGTLWNSFKRMTHDRPISERRALFHDTAAQVYGLASEPG